MTTTLPLPRLLVTPTGTSPSTAAFERIVAEHQHAVCAVAFSTLRDRAASEEIAQEAFLVAWRRLPGLDAPPALPAWICGIARNLARNARRRAARSQPTDAADEVVAAQPSQEEELAAAEEGAVVDAALAGLEEQYREPLVLFYRQEASMRAVASALEISEDAAKQRVSRARAKLAERVQAMVERSLRKSGPGATFTAGVMTAIAALPRDASAAAASEVSSATQPAAAKSALGLGLLPAALLVGAMGLGAYLLVGRGAEPRGAHPIASESARSATHGSSALGRAPDGRDEQAYGQRWASAAQPRRAKLAPTAAAADPAPVRAQVASALDRRIDLTLNQAKTTEVLALLADVAATPIVVSGELDDTVSVDLRAVTVRDALDETLEAAHAVWEEVDLVRVTATAGPMGPALEGAEVDLRLVEAPLGDVVAALAAPLDVATEIEPELAARPITLGAKRQRAGDVLAVAVAQVGARYEIVPAIEVRPSDDDE